MTPSNPDQPGRQALLLRVGLFALIGYLGIATLPSLMSPLGGVLVASALSTFAAAALANVIVVRLFENGRLSDLGLGWTPRSGREILAGIAAGASAGALIILGPLAAGEASFERVPGADHPWASFALISVVLLFGAAGEEMLFHGYGFQLLVRTLGAFATILPVSILFGLAHMGNQNANLLGIVNTIFWGILLGYSYARTNALWLPIGLHFGWNFALAILGVNLSGFTIGVTGYGLLWRAGALWSGGAYGPEGSVLTTGVVVALFFLLLRLTPEEAVE
jgi:hypothetical protein